MRIRKHGYFLCFQLLFVAVAGSAMGQTSSHELVGLTVKPPIGWAQFCTDNAADCAPSATSPREIVMDQKAWRDLTEVNRWVNKTVKPITDIDHWGEIEKWSYPTDGYGDCEEYVLMKRKTLIDAGWPMESLLITVVRDQNDEGHAVLTVTTDHGDFILDNERTDIVRWYETGYRFIKRQSQNNQNVWVALGDLPGANSSTTAATH